MYIVQQITKQENACADKAPVPNAALADLWSSLEAQSFIFHIYGTLTAPIN